MNQMKIAGRNRIFPPCNGCAEKLQALLIFSTVKELFLHITADSG